MNRTGIIPLEPKAESIPAELRSLEHWTVWRYEIRDGKLTKVPNGSIDDPTTWRTYDAAISAVAEIQAMNVKWLKGDGVGFVFSGEDPYVGVDIDGCVRDGAIHPDAQAVIDELDSYWELSPSGTGVHVFVRGELPADSGNRAMGPWGGSLEVYERGRFFTVTGAGSGEIAERTEVLARLAERYLPQRAPELDETERGARDYPGTDASLLARLRRDRRFAKVFSGRTIPAGKDGDSDADFELCCRIAELTAVPERIERLWGQSALGQRGKFARDDYRRSTIQRAIAATAGERWAGSGVVVVPKKTTTRPPTTCGRRSGSRGTTTRPHRVKIKDGGGER